MLLDAFWVILYTLGHSFIKHKCILISLISYISWFFETGFLCVTVLAVLELAFVDQAGLELTKIHLPLLPECSD